MSTYPTPDWIIRPFSWFLDRTLAAYQASRLLFILGALALMALLTWASDQPYIGYIPPGRCVSLSCDCPDAPSKGSWARTVGSHAKKP